MILLMFALGLEFSLRKLASVGATAGHRGAAVQRCCGSATRSRPASAGRAEAMFTGAIIAISSTTIIAKAFDEQGVRGRLRELVVGIPIVEDLMAILLMAGLTAIASGAGCPCQPAADGWARSAFLRSCGSGCSSCRARCAASSSSSATRPRWSRASASVSWTACSPIRLLGRAWCVPRGSLVAEFRRVASEVERLVLPVRDVFAAVFSSRSA